MKQLDLLLVNARSRISIYGSLSEFAAVEPPVWGLFITQHCLNLGYSVEILDAEAEGLTTIETAARINDAKPCLAVFCVYGQQPSASTQCLPGAEAVAKMVDIRIPTLCLGTHPSALPERTLREGPWSYVCQGEGPETIVLLLTILKNVDEDQPFARVPGLWWKKKLGIVEVMQAPIGLAKNTEDLDNELPNQAWELLDMKRYRPHHWHRWTGDPNGGYASVQTSLNCTFNCLRGDTLVNTIYGDIPIEVLAKSGIESIPVYTYKDGEVKIADAINIKKLGVNKKLVRVAFDDGTYIDCTPDHKFLTFRINTPSIGNVKETAIEAQFLQHGDRLRAMALRYGINGRKTVECGRNRGKYNAVMIMEYLLKRKLKKREKVHHDDHDPGNDFPSNLILCSSWLDHIKNHHLEVSARMKNNNPMHDKRTAKKVSVTAKANVKSGRIVPFLCTTKGKKAISKIARARALSDNPMKRPEIAMAPALRRSRSLRMKKLWADRETALEKLGRKEINHHVVGVRPLAKRDDVYCMEVPGYGWFFANNVLVKNCNFCCISAPFGDRKMRFWSSGSVVKQIEDLVIKYKITNIKIPDEMFCLNKQHVKDICNKLILRGIVGDQLASDQLNLWAYARVDTVKDTELLDLMRRAGFKWLGIGIESASKHVRDGIEKGRFGNQQIFDAISRVNAAGINVGANYIFGLPDDTLESMKETYDLACTINAPYANFYCCMAYPGSPLHKTAQEKGWLLPEDTDAGWLGYSQHSYETLPLPTETLTAAEVLRFRDEAFMRYHQRPEYLSLLQNKFGPQAMEDMKKILAHGRPKRKLLGDKP